MSTNLDIPEYEGYDANDDAWVICDGCSRNIPSAHPEFMLWTEFVYWDSALKKTIGEYLCPDCDYDPETPVV
jgi:hypothetical protein